jgi:hypothetical protein
MNFEVAPCRGLILASVAGVLDLLVYGPLVHVQAAHLTHGTKVLSLQCCGSVTFCYGSASSDPYFCGIRMRIREAQKHLYPHF